jgi:hypothetical protein
MWLIKLFLFQKMAPKIRKNHKILVFGGGGGGGGWVVISEKKHLLAKLRNFATKKKH